MEKEKENMNESNQIPIMNHLNLLKKRKNHINKKFKETNKKFLNSQTNMIILGNKILHNDEVEIKLILEEIARISKELNIFDKKEKEDNIFLKKQINHLFKEKYKMKKKSILLQQRIAKIDNEIGFN